MATTRGSIVGREVYDKRAGVMGKVLKEDGLSLVIEFSTPDGTTTKTITPATFNRWYRLLDPEPAEETPVVDVSKTDSRVIPEEHVGAKGAGPAMCNLFLRVVKSSANQDLEVTSTKDKRTVVIKYNGKNVFEVTVCKRRLVVLCHPKSLAPSNVAQIVKQYPKEHGWPLSAKFVFTDESQLPLMRSIINDGLFYRQIVEKEEA